jgi:hypothetical protein
VQQTAAEFKELLWGDSVATDLLDSFQEFSGNSDLKELVTAQMRSAVAEVISAPASLDAGNGEVEPVTIGAFSDLLATPQQWLGEQAEKITSDIVDALGDIEPPSLPEGVDVDFLAAAFEDITDALGDFASGPVADILNSIDMDGLKDTIMAHIVQRAAEDSTLTAEELLTGWFGAVRAELEGPLTALVDALATTGTMSGRRHLQSCDDGVEAAYSAACRGVHAELGPAIIFTIDIAELLQSYKPLKFLRPSFQIFWTETASGFEPKRKFFGSKDTNRIEISPLGLDFKFVIPLRMMDWRRGGADVVGKDCPTIASHIPQALYRTEYGTNNLGCLDCVDGLFDTCVKNCSSLACLPTGGHEDCRDSCLKKVAPDGYLDECRGEMKCAPTTDTTTTDDPIYKTLPSYWQAVRPYISVGTPLTIAGDVKVSLPAREWDLLESGSKCSRGAECDSGCCGVSRQVNLGNNIRNYEAEQVLPPNEWNMCVEPVTSCESVVFDRTDPAKRVQQVNECRSTSLQLNHEHGDRCMVQSTYHQNNWYEMHQKSLDVVGFCEQINNNAADCKCVLITAGYYDTYEFGCVADCECESHKCLRTDTTTFGKCEPMPELSATQKRLDRLKENPLVNGHSVGVTWDHARVPGWALGVAVEFAVNDRSVAYETGEGTAPGTLVPFTFKDSSIPVWANFDFLRYMARLTDDSASIAHGLIQRGVCRDQFAVETCDGINVNLCERAYVNDSHQSCQRNGEACEGREVSFSNYPNYRVEATTLSGNIRGGAGMDPLCKDTSIGLGFGVGYGYDFAFPSPYTKRGWFDDDRISFDDYGRRRMQEQTPFGPAHGSSVPRSVGS